MNKTQEIKSLQSLGNAMRARRKKIKQDIQDYYDSLKPKEEEDKKELSRGDKIARFMKSKTGKTIFFIAGSIFLLSVNNPLAGKILSVSFLWFVTFICL